MLNISKYHRAIVGCSAIATASFAGFVQSANAVEQFANQNTQIDRGTILIAGNASNGTGTNVSNTTGTNVSNGSGGNISNGTGSNSQPKSGGGYSSEISSRAGNVLSRYNSALSKYEQAAAALAQAETGQPVRSNNSPVRYGREPGDLAACGCLNQDTADTGRPDLTALKAQEAEAAAELAAAKAEARQFVESAKSSNTATGSTTFSPIW